MDRISKEKRSKVMSSIRSSGTSIERKLAERLPDGFIPQYRIAFNCDFAYVTEKICIFVDGNFWHGKDFDVITTKLNEHWQKHIGGNIERDKRNRTLLVDAGWIVLSYWEDEINSDIELIIKDIKDVLEFRRNNLPPYRQTSLY